ncbi:MAG: hypothetical protein HY552_03910 [Elusimicrobia bacterium]|nr:hypothetical protein [Elusimicrobiota bacterium]
MNRLKAAAGIVAVVAAAGAGHKYLELSRLAQTPDPVKTGKLLPAAEASPVSAPDPVAKAPAPRDKADVLRILEEGPSELREEILARLGTGGARGPEVYAKVLELADKGMIPDALLPQALRRAGGLKARDAITTLLKSTDNARLIAGCAVALQDYKDPDVLGLILENLEQAGLLESNAKLPWISAPLLNAHMKTADNAQFRRGLAAMAARPRLARIEHLRKGLESPDAQTRRLAAVAVRKAALAKVIDAAQGEALLAGRLQVEKEPVLVAELTGGLESLRGLLSEKKASLQ